MNGKNINDFIGQSKKKLENYTKKDLVEIISNTQQEVMKSKTISSEDCEKMIEFLDAKISNMEKNIISKLVSENEKLTKWCNELENVNNRLVERAVKMERTIGRMYNTQEEIILRLLESLILLVRMI